MNLENPRDLQVKAEREVYERILKEHPLRCGLKMDYDYNYPILRTDNYLEEGGIGAFCGRDLKEYREFLGEAAIEELTGCSGVIYHLGNGTSLAFYEIIQLQKQNGIKPAKNVLIDKIDLPLLLEDLTVLETELQKNKLSLSSSMQNTKARTKIILEQPTEEVEVVRGLVGQDNLRGLYGNADYVVNVYGVSVFELEEMLKLLKPGGVMFTLVKQKHPQVKTLLENLQAQILSCTPLFEDDRVRIVKK